MEHKNPRISIIMGIYNCESTLSQALDSLLNQSFQDFKVIMCDDGSTDNTYTIAQTFVEKYPTKFILLRNENNLTLAPTLNKCLELADTEFTARMDGDDISLPNRLEEEIKFLDNNPQYAIVSTPMIHFDEKGEFMRGKGGNAPSNEDFRYGPPFCHAPCMIRTAAFKAVGGYTTGTKTLRMEDYYLWYKLYKSGYKGYNLAEPLYMMRDDRNATQRRFNLKQRYIGFKTDIEIARGLGLERPLLYPVIHFIAGSISQYLPYSIIKSLRKKLNAFKQENRALKSENIIGD